MTAAMAGARVANASYPIAAVLSPIVTVEMREYLDFDGFMTIESLSTTNVDLTERIDVRSVNTITYEYNYGDETETEAEETTLAFLADYIDNDAMKGFAGTMTETVVSEGTTTVITGDISAALTAESTFDFDMPANVIDITDEEAEGRDELIAQLQEAMNDFITVLTGITDSASLFGVYLPIDAIETMIGEA